MNCISNMNRYPIPSDLYMISLNLYYKMGKNSYYLNLFKKDQQLFRIKNAERESSAFMQFFFSDLKIPSSRMKTLLLDSTVARNKSEVLYKNIIEIFRTIHDDQASKFHFNVTEIHDLAKILYREYYPIEKIQYRKIERKGHSLISTEITSKREQLEELIRKVDEIKKQKLTETVYLYLNFIIDFIEMEPFKIENHVPLALLLLYLLLLNEGLVVFQFESLFERFIIQKQDFYQTMDKAKVGWSEGFSEVFPLTRFFVKLLSKMYDDLSDKARDYDYENNLEISKSDYIENTIDKLEDVFSKDEIRTRHPLISDSTINRTLKRLQEENKIRPLGTGRSAKWIKLYKKEKKAIVQEQLAFDLGD